MASFVRFKFAVYFHNPDITGTKWLECELSQSVNGICDDSDIPLPCLWYCVILYN